MKTSVWQKDLLFQEKVRNNVHQNFAFIFFFFFLCFLYIVFPLMYSYLQTYLLYEQRKIQEDKHKYCTVISATTRGCRNGLSRKTSIRVTTTMTDI